MQVVLQPRTFMLCWVGFVLASVVHVGSAGVWKVYKPSSVAQHAPIIVSGKIVKIDVAAAETREGDQLRFLDRAHIRIDRVHKIALSDFDSKPTTITAFMHSVDKTVPGSETKDGSKVCYSTSMDLRYEVETEAVWLLFLKENGRFYINCHPQQHQPLDKEEDFLKTGVFRVQDQLTTKADWVRQGRSAFNQSKQLLDAKVRESKP